MYIRAGDRLLYKYGDSHRIPGPDHMATYTPQVEVKAGSANTEESVIIDLVRQLPLKRQACNCSYCTVPVV